MGYHFIGWALNLRRRRFKDMLFNTTSKQFGRVESVTRALYNYINKQGIDPSYFLLLTFLPTVVQSLCTFRYVCLEMNVLCCWAQEMYNSSHCFALKLSNWSHIPGMILLFTFSLLIIRSTSQNGCKTSACGFLWSLEGFFIALGSENVWQAGEWSFENASVHSVMERKWDIFSQDS